MLDIKKIFLISLISISAISNAEASGGVEQRDKKRIEQKNREKSNRLQEKQRAKKSEKMQVQREARKDVLRHDSLNLPEELVHHIDKFSGNPIIK